MSNNAKYILYNILDYGLTYGGTTAVIVLNYISKDTSVGYKLSFTGILLVVVLLLSVKAIFEHTYQDKMNNLLQELAQTTNEDVKKAIISKIDSYKQANVVYRKLTQLMPFAILYIVSALGVEVLEELNATTGLILVSMGAGSVFNVIKQPLASQVSLDKINVKVNKAKKQ